MQTIMVKKNLSLQFHRQASENKENFEKILQKIANCKYYGIQEVNLLFLWCDLGNPRISWKIFFWDLCEFWANWPKIRFSRVFQSSPVA